MKKQKGIKNVNLLSMITKLSNIFLLLQIMQHIHTIIITIQIGNIVSLIK